MTLLTPLGLLGLAAIAVLILIYILRPNYQQKRVSTTFVWKLSLKYKKKTIPISKLRNILIIICQILILIACAFMLTQPQKVLIEKTDLEETILVIDSSASMRASTEDETRFERALKKAAAVAEEVMQQGGNVSVIIADNNPYFLCERVTAETRNILDDCFSEIRENAGFCSYGSSDIDAAMRLCKQITSENPNTAVTLITDITYDYVPQTVSLINVCEEEEWNAAILNAYAELEDNYYTFYVDVACYGRDTVIAVNLEVQGANPYDSKDKEGTQILFSADVECERDTTKTLIFKYFIDGDVSNMDEEENTKYVNINQADRIYSYQNVHISIDEFDSFIEDNNFVIYGGRKEVIKIQYISGRQGSVGLESPNTFFSSILFVLRDYYKDKWDIQITEVRDFNYEDEGYDFYIFEHAMPERLPTDGFILLSDLDIAPSNSGIRLGGEREIGDSLTLTEESTHPILTGVIADELTVSKYRRIIHYDYPYQLLMTCDGDPMLLVKDEEEAGDGSPAKVAVMPFSVHFSNLVIRPSFPNLIYNLMEYFLPATVEKDAFEVYEKIAVKARGTSVSVKGYPDYIDTINELPATISFAVPGTYELSQVTYTGKQVTESIYVTIPALESNIWSREDTFENPHEAEDNNQYFEDLMFYLAIVLVAILFLEWILNIQDRV